MKTIVIESLKGKRQAPTASVKIVLLGLTPGARQHRVINASDAPRAGSFIGMRGQIHQWFDKLGINSCLNLENEDSLFTDSDLIRTSYMTSIIRDPVYVIKDGQKKNYSGRQPYPWQDEKIWSRVEETLSLLESNLAHSALIVPMGNIVSKCISQHSSIDKSNIVLHGFPHPSGANANRRKQFLKAKDNLMILVRKWSKNF